MNMLLLWNIPLRNAVMRNMNKLVLKHIQAFLTYYGKFMLNNHLMRVKIYNIKFSKEDNLIVFCSSANKSSYKANSSQYSQVTPSYINHGRGIEGMQMDFRFLYFESTNLLVH